jgi:hypothetical protein
VHPYGWCSHTANNDIVYELLKPVEYVAVVPVALVVITGENIAVIVPYVIVVADTAVRLKSVYQAIFNKKTN